MTSKYCDFSGSLTCPYCGYRARRRKTFRVCGPVPPKPLRTFKVGDAVEKVLTSVGVTKDLVERLTRTSGKPGGCGCDARKSWMNDWGDRVQVEAVKALVRFRDFCLPQS